MSKEIDYTKLMKFCETEKETEILSLRLAGVSYGKIAKRMDIGKSTARDTEVRVRRRAELRGYDPEHDLTHECGENFLVTGVSSYYSNPDAGPDEPKGQWVKTKKNAEEIQAQMRATFESMCEDIPPTREIPKPTGVEKDLLSVIPIGDSHLGLMAWGEETGDDHDLEIGIRDLLDGMRRAIYSTPACGECLIINTGDFFHSDLMDNKTWRSGHILDVDGRWMKIHKAGVLALRTCIETALERHEKVTLINAIGNHDDHSAMMLSICLEQVYENNPRVHINASPKNVYMYRFGNNLIGAHHGHQIKPPQLPLLMANEWPKDWGETEFRVWYTGHVHHDSVKEYNGCVVETVRVLAGRDAYASSHGYYAQRDLKAIVHHREYGPEERHIIPLKRIRDGQKGR